MVKTVSPKAHATPKKPMPVLGKPAASTAAPQPPKTSQNVPMNSAAARVPKDINLSSCKKGSFDCISGMAKQETPFRRGWKAGTGAAYSPGEATHQRRNL